MHIIFTYNFLKGSNGYKSGFNGQMKDDEIYGEGNAYSAEFWEYDARIGRRWNLDPVDQVSISNYATFANNPIFYTDPYGDRIKASFRERQQLRKRNDWKEIKKIYGGYFNDNVLTVNGTNDNNFSWGSIYVAPISKVQKGLLIKTPEFREDVVSEDGSNRQGFDRSLCQMQKEAGDPAKRNDYLIYDKKTVYTLQKQGLSVISPDLPTSNQINVKPQPVYWEPSSISQTKTQPTNFSLNIPFNGNQSSFVYPNRANASLQNVTNIALSRNNVSITIVINTNLLENQRHQNVSVNHRNMTLEQLMWMRGREIRNTLIKQGVPSSSFQNDNWLDFKWNTPPKCKYKCALNEKEIKK